MDSLWYLTDVIFYSALRNKSWLSISPLGWEIGLKLYDVLWNCLPALDTTTTQQQQPTSTMINSEIGNARKQMEGKQTFIQYSCF